MHWINGLLLLSLLTSAGLQAQAVRTWVSATGLDANPCSRNSPCRNFGAAINAVAPGGEVVVLDSGGYGPVVITKPVSIISPPGIHGAIAPTGGDAVVINVDSNTDEVTLRGLFLNSQGGQRGIQILGGKAVHVENCIVSGFQQTGIAFNLSGTPDFYLVEFYLIDSVIRNSGQSGLQLSANGAVLRALIEHSRMEQNSGHGVMASSNVRMAIRDSLVKAATGSLSAAVLVFAEAAGTNTDVTVENCAFFGSGSSIGLSAQSIAGTAHVTLSRSTILSESVGIHLDGDQTTVVISGNTITHNVAGASATGSALLVSRQNNTFSYNGSDINALYALLPPQ